MKRAGAAALLAFVGQFLIVPVILLYLCEWTMLDEGYHASLLTRLNAAQNTGLTEAGVREAIHTLDDYLKGRRSDIALTAPVYGVSAEVFNAREKAHMLDVKALFEGGRRIRGALLAAGGLMIALSATLAPKGTERRMARLRLRACLIWAALLGALAAACAVDFNAVFLRFHALLFDNDLWLLDPRTDLMIRLLPEAFFEAVAARTIRVAVGGFAILTALCALLAWWRKKTEA